MGLSVWFGVQDLRCRAQGFELFLRFKAGVVGFRVQGFITTARSATSTASRS